MMDSAAKEIEKKYSFRAITTAIILCSLCMIAGYKPIGKGIILGALFSVINFILMGENLSRRLQNQITPSKSELFFKSILSIGVRYILMAIPLFAAIRYQDEYHLFGAIIGIFMVQIMILIDHFYNLYFLTRKKIS